MVREVLTINVGQCGVQLGSMVWQQYCSEHHIDYNGNIIKTNNNKINNNNNNNNKVLEDTSFTCFFQETNEGRFVPRNIMIDLEPNVIDDIKTSEISNIFDHNFLIAGHEDAADNFARGHYTVGKEVIAEVNEKIRKLVSNCDNCQGFIMNHSVGGGTGSGLGTLILEKLSLNYNKLPKLGFEVYPSPNISTSIVAPYNALLTTHLLLDYINISLLFDNEAIYNICQRNLDIHKPDYNNLNLLICKIISSMTTSLRFSGELNVDLIEFQTNLVPFPRLHFLITSIAPILNANKLTTFTNQSQSEHNFDVQEITELCFDPKNLFAKINDFDVELDKYMAILLNYRGNIQAKEASLAVNWIKDNKKVSIVDWCPTGFKVGLNAVPITVLNNNKYDIIAPVKKNCVMIGNNTCVSRIFHERINKKFDLLYSQRSFLHWFIGEGMEEFEFEEAREDLEFLEKDYLDALQCDEIEENDY